MDDLDTLKRDPRVLQIYNQYTRLKKEGNLWKGTCPVHSERTPSFVVYQDMLCCCFGCGYKSNIFQLVEKKDGVSFVEAVEKVRRILGTSTSNWSRDAAAVDATFRPIQDTPKTFKTYTLSEYAFFEKDLPEAVHFLDRRGISLETARKLHLGYRQSVKKLAGEKNQDIADSGWLAMPRIEGDTVVGIHYRSVVEGRKAFCRQPGMQTALFNTQTIDMFDSLYVVEGEMDACVLEQADFRSVSIPSASTNLSPSQKDQIMAAGTVILAGDCDDGPGSEKMNKLWRELSERTYLLKWPVGMKDANQTLLEFCKGDYTKFKAEVDKLTQQAKTIAIPDVYNLQEVMRSSQQGSLVDVPNRLHFPQPDVDKMAVLLPGSVLGVLATNTSMGKTPFVLQASLHNARHHGDVVINWQCELSPEEISTIVTAQVLHKDRNHLTPEDKKEAADILGDTKYYVGYNPDLMGDQVLDLIEAAIRRLGATVVVLDTFHNVFISETNGVAVETAAANRIKNIARKYGTKWINVFQPRKAQQQARGKKIHITDIRGAGAAADCCDAVMAMHRELARSDGDEPLDDIYDSKTLIQAQKTRAKGLGKSETYLQFFGMFGTFEQIDYRYGENSPPDESI
jgi:hypothetical protein